MQMKTYAGWLRGDLKTYLNIGDFVDEEMVGHFRNVMPPASDTSQLIQLGEANSYVEARPVYPTLVRETNGWQYAGHCFRGETLNRVK